ncbi:MAG: hypothetical protein FWJ90_11660 [Actinomadura sp.]
MTWDEVRDEALRLLPGALFRRHLLFRYSLVWRKPRRSRTGATKLENTGTVGK